MRIDLRACVGSVCWLFQRRYAGAYVFVRLLLQFFDLKDLSLNILKIQPKLMSHIFIFCENIRLSFVSILLTCF